MHGNSMVECIPNFSEGRRPEVIEALASSIRSVEGVRLLDASSDRDHNRCVMTFIGRPDRVQEAVLASVGTALDLIDMEQHEGEHPRIGAADVIPFVPVLNMDMADCVELAHQTGREIAERFQLPVYFYEEAALTPDRRNLADIRSGNYERLKDEIGKPERRPDVGPAAMHPKGGAVVVGARRPLIAYNINLSTSDVSIARRIAKRIRAKDGGLAGVKALGVLLKDRSCAQVTINLVDYTKTSIYTVFEMVCMEARRWGVSITDSEIIGLAPMEALIETTRYYLRMPDFKTSQVIEHNLIGE
jgi:glutamate formiminotransferase